MSSRGSTIDDVEDWLDIGDSGSAPSLSLDDVLAEVDNLDEGLSFTEETLHDGDGGSQSITCESPPIGSDYMTYYLDSAVVVHPHNSISHQISSLRSKSGTAVAITERNGIIAIGTSKGHVLIFDLDGKLDRYIQGDDNTAAVACITFSLDGKHLAVGFSKGSVKIINVNTGKVRYSINEAVQPGLGVLQILYISKSSAFLTLDSGGSVYEVRFKSRITGQKNYSMRCIFSGCNGEVVNMRILPNSMLALLTVSKLLLVSTRFGGRVLGSFSLEHSYKSPPLFAYWLGCSKKSVSVSQSESPLKALASNSLRDFKICVSRGDKTVIFRLHTNNFGTKHKSATIYKNITLPVVLANLFWMSSNMIVGIDGNGAIWQIDTEKGSVKKSNVDNLEVIFSTSDFKGLATGGRVSEAMWYIAEMACFQSMVSASSTSDRLIVLAHDGLKIVEKVSEWEQLERFRERDDEISASLFLLDVVREKLRAGYTFKNEASGLLLDSLRKLLDITMNGFKEGKVSQLYAHYKKYIRVILNVCVLAKFNDFLYEDVWNKLSLDKMSKSIMFELMDEFVLDGALVNPPPTIVSEYLQNLASEGHFSQFQAAVVRFPIHSIDLHVVMSTCRLNGLYDGIIYIMNNALMDFISPLEEMLDAVREFACREVLTDSEIDIGNRLLLYLNCCLSGRAYPIGMLSDDLVEKVPLEVYRCMCSLKGKDGSLTEEHYPYLRLLLQFDPQQFIHVICTCADANLFQVDGRLQRISDIIGLICVSLRTEACLLNFLQLVVQLSERCLIAPPVELVQDAVIILLRLTIWQQADTEKAIVSALKNVSQLNTSLVLRASQNPMRPAICSFLYLNERKFIELVNCYLETNNGEVFEAIDQILKASNLEMEESEKFVNYVRSLIPRLMRVDVEKCAYMINEHFCDYLKEISDVKDENGRKEIFAVLKGILSIRKERKQSMISDDEDLDEFLFGIVFEGICKNWDCHILDGNDNYDSTDMILVDLLSFWLPIGSKNDFCLNQAAASMKCPHTVIQLLESRNHLERAFEVIFEQLEKFGGLNDVQLVHWLDELLLFCSKHSAHKNAKEWILRVFQFVASQIGQQPSDETKKEINKRLQCLCKRIIDTGTEHAGLLVESLLECPSFGNLNYSYNSDLIDEILASCEYEINLYKNVIRIMNSENTNFVQSMCGQIGRRCELTASSECISCCNFLNKSGYVYSCGHFQHIECATSSNKSCPCEEKAESSSEIRKYRIIPRQIELKAKTKKDIFVDWERPLDLCPRGEKTTNS